MHSQQKTPLPPPEENEARGSLWRVWGDVSRGAEHLPPVGVALPESRIARFTHGVSLPWHVLRALLTQPRTRRRYLTVCLAQAGTILALGLLATLWSDGVADQVGEKIEQQVDADEAHAEAGPGVEAREGDDAEDDEKVVVELPRSPESHSHTRVKVDLGGGHSVTRAVARVMRGGEGGAEPRKGWGRWFVYGAALLSTLHVAQWAVIALSRDFHTELSREASVLMGLPLEDEPLVPRVRLNFRWMRNKLKRRWRAFLVFAIGAPVLWLCKWLVPGGQLIAPVLVALWGAWWFVVFTAGKSALAWNEQSPGEPWFLRAWGKLTGWFWPLRSYGALWTRTTEPVFSPIARVERAPWGFAGLALVRTLTALPLVKCFLRPLIPVASAHLLMADSMGAPPTPEQNEEG